MKKLLLLLLLSFLIFGCGKRVNEEPIKIYVEEGIRKNGVLAWGKNIVWVNRNDDPDLLMLKTNRLPGYWQAMFVWYGFCQKYMKRPAYIYILNNSDVPIAHDFGNFLGYKDNNTNMHSIMCASWETINKPLSWFDEFKTNGN